MVSTLQVAPSNAEQARAWDGREGAYWAEHADRFDRAIGPYDRHFLAAADVSATDHVLDIGCGTGEITRDVARRADSGRVLGVDLSAAMLRVARQRAADEGLHNADFVQADAQVHPFPAASFDVAVSRTGTMFFADPVTAFRNIGTAMRPGGRLVQLVWQPPTGNEWLRSFARALSAGRPLPTPRRTRPGRSRWPTPCAYGGCSAPPASRTSNWSRTARRCGSARTRPTRSGSYSACTAGCSTDSMTRVDVVRSTT